MEWKSIISSFVGMAIILIVGYWWSDIPVLESQVSDLKNQTNIMNTQIDSLISQQIRIESFLSYKFPKYNFRSLMSVSAKKNLTQDEFNEVILNIEQHPQEAQSYLMKTLGITHTEAASIINPTTGNPEPEKKE